MIQPPPAGAVPPLRPVPLAELRWQADGRRWDVDQPIEGLESLLPVRGQLRVCHHGNALEVEGSVETIVTLCCDRCLQPFNQRLRVETRELLELLDGGGPGGVGAGSAGEGLPPLLELADGLDDRLDPLGRFDPERWLFEQLSLRLPLVNRCGDDCPGPPSWGDGAAASDPRWAALRNLRPS
jgi:uncharacterized protein